MRNARVVFTLAMAAVLLGLLPTKTAHAQFATALLREGDTLGAFGTVNSLNNPSVNNVGGFSIQVNSLSGPTTYSHIWGHATGGAGALINTEGTYAGYLQTAFESFNGFDDAGLAAYGVTATEISSGMTGLDGVFVDTARILVEREPVPSMPGQWSVFNSRPGITGNGIPYWVGGISNTQGGASQNRVLFYKTGADPLFKGGDIVGGVGLPQTTGTMDFDQRMSRLGTHYIIEAQVTGATTATDTMIVVDGSTVSAGGGLLREGSPVPAAVGGLPGENWANWDFKGVTESGMVFVTGDTSAATTVDEFVFRGSQIVLREGTVFPGPGGNYTLSGDIEGGYMNRQGDWAVTWDANNPSAVNIEILLVNGAMVLKEGDLVDLNGDGTVDASSRLADFTGISSLVLGPRDGSGMATVYFTADIDTLGTPSSTDDTEALLRLVVPITAPNQDPIALCQDVTIVTSTNCNTAANVDDGSSDPDDDPITLNQNPPGPYGFGTTSVMLTVTDVLGATDTCTANVTLEPVPLTIDVDPTQISWGPAVCDIAYDVVYGDAGALVASGGNYGTSTTGCVQDDHPTTTLPYAAIPAPDTASWFLVRRVNTGGNGTYDGDSPGQVGTRDGEIAGSGNDCP